VAASLSHVPRCTPLARSLRHRGTQRAGGVLDLP